jgi:peptidoglycan/LPS O-acetylase OafA/YrhL
MPEPTPKRGAVPFAIALCAGAAVWILASIVGGRREAWDSDAYWTVGYPLALLVSGALGYRFPERAWRWALAVFAGQFVAMVVRNGEIGGLAPLGLALFAIFALPAVAVAMVASRMRRRPADDRR